MKQIIKIQALIGAVSFIIINNYVGLHEASSFVFGLILSFLSIFSLWAILKLGFEKKLIALAMTIIVFKYSIFAGIVYVFVKLPWVKLVWLSLGIGSLILLSILMAFGLMIQNSKDEKNKSENK